MPVLIAIVSIVMNSIQNHKRINTTVSDLERKEAMSTLFDLVDVDGSNHVDAKEFKIMLKELGHKRLNLTHIEHMMKRISGEETTTNGTIYLSRDQFITAALAGKIADTSAEKWIQHVQIQNNRSQIYSAAFQAFALIHAPVSAKLFYYFDCHVIGSKEFLRADYSMRCYDVEWNSFLPYVMLFLLFFTFALPTALIVDCSVKKEMKPSKYRLHSDSV